VRSADALWLVYVVQFVEQATGQFFTPAKRALVPRLVPRQHLAAANALDELALGAGRLLGPPLGGALLGLLGFESVVLLDAGSFLVSAVLLASIAVEPAAAQSHQLGLRSQGSQSGAVRSPSSPRPGSGWPATRARRCTLWCSAGSVWPAVWREWLAGLRLLRGQRVLVTLFGLKALVMVAYGIVFVLLVVFVRDVRGGGPLELAWFTTAQGLGTVLGSAVAGRLGRAVAPGRLFAAGLAAVGIGFVATFNAPALPLALASILVAGAGLVGSAVGERTLLQTRVADAYRGRAFATYDTGGAGLMLVGQGVAAVLGPAAGVAAALDVAGALYLAAAVGAHALLPRVREPSEE
jgi:MFS family permease